MFKNILMLTAALAFAGCSAETVTSAPKAEAQSADTPPADKITATDLGSGIHMLSGPGGNIGVSVGDDGVLVIDDKFERNGGAIIDAIAAISTGKIRYVLNTHHHGDHTGSNAVLAKAGGVIVAHDNVRKRMGMTYENKAFGRTQEARDESLWPVVTYSDTATFFFNGDSVKAVHVPTAHTDGDSLIHFASANVLHMGDNFFNGMFPFVDVDSGGSLSGMIAAQETGLAMTNADTTIIPGHGVISSQADLKDSIATLKDIRARVQAGIDAGDDVDAMVKAEILSDYKSMAAFIDEAGFIGMAHRSLTGG